MLLYVEEELTDCYMFVSDIYSIVLNCLIDTDFLVYLIFE